MNRLGSSAILCFVCALINPAFAGVDALTAKVNTADADRFAAIFKAAGGKPSAAALQKGYIGPGSRGIEIFTPNRILDAEHLAATIAKNPDLYRRAIDVCLPIAKASSDELRSIYLGFQGLLGKVNLPEIYVVFGADNSGGTAGPGAQVLGLEVICRLADTEKGVRRILRTFYAHETVHTLQVSDEEMNNSPDPLLTAVMHEGTADFVAWLVTGKIPGPERDAWARPREAFIWREFMKDRKALQGKTLKEAFARKSPLYRWVGNAGSAQKDWPGELGYWLGMRICMAYFDAAQDKRAAVKTLLKAVDYGPILARSGYARRFRAAH